MVDPRLELERYKDSFGLVHPRAGEITGNGLIFTAEAIVALHRRGLLKPEDVEWFRKVASSCIRDGLVSRHPTAFHNDQEGPDDYYGIAVACLCLGIKDIPQQILACGRAHSFWKYYIPLRYYFRNELPYTDQDQRAWLGRQPGLIGLLELAAGEGLPWWRELFLHAAIRTTGWFGPGPRENGGQDGWRLSFLVSHALEFLSSAGRDSAEVLRKKIEQTWGAEGMRAVYRQYFGEENWFTQFGTS